MTDEVKQKKDELDLEIIRLKKMLEFLYAENKPLNQGLILSISRLLDEKINQYMKLQLKEQKETEERL